MNSKNRDFTFSSCDLWKDVKKKKETQQTWNKEILIEIVVGRNLGENASGLDNVTGRCVPCLLLQSSPPLWSTPRSAIKM